MKNIHLFNAAATTYAIKPKSYKVEFNGILKPAPSTWSCPTILVRIECFSLPPAAPKKMTELELGVSIPASFYSSPLPASPSHCSLTVLSFPVSPTIFHHEDMHASNG